MSKGKKFDYTRPACLVVKIDMEYLVATSDGEIDFGGTAGEGQGELDIL